ncbi:hypothetical protein H2202_010985 [Exophiala xenobiotica]|nr:hypothetical protein H2202_010985 [Exophiala xenobiotica]KAK5217736.1 hypothetical protein LTR72_009399 [Exophiala xenobiotica]KAK5261344.1 hypothetical protein LTR40_002428 [Exophiala xenobiotica]KAK5375143.1 hypothetical protein LTS03_005697 [Exophiala xenobiotica]KAK5494601.1 hypothetical protein LTR55_002988 [Exophiala xenobiotica]
MQVYPGIWSPGARLGETASLVASRRRRVLVEHVLSKEDSYRAASPGHSAMMMYLQVLLLLAACSPSHYVRAAAVPQILDPEIDRVDDNGVIRNANHIFNAIHSSMRQWGSSLNHNGMSFFLAQVPAGTQFYHGTGQPEPVQGMEWLAFEPEHAIVFARKMKHHPMGSPHGGPGQDDRHAPPPHFFDDDSGRNHEYAVHRFPPPEKAGRKPHPSLSSKEGCHNRPDRILSPLGREDRLDRQRPHTEDRPALHESSQNPLMPNDDKDKRPRRPPFEMEPGWLHTYKTKDTLPLLYIDGMSAGKSDKGTLDSQDTLLLNVTENQDRHGFWEVERANRLCKLAKDTWDGKVKGFIRMEAGFEIILCSFAEDLDFVRAVKAGPFAPNGQDPDNNNNTDEPSPGRGGGGGGGKNWIKAITARYDGIGGDRVKVDYDTFVTSYAYDLDLFKDHDSALPRLENLSVASLDEVRNDVDAMVRKWDPSKLKQDSTSPINWQSIADMVVERYAKELQYLVSGGGLNTPDAFFSELGVMLQVFIDSDLRNTTAEVERCVGQFIPAGGVKLVESSLAGRAISSVAERICSSLFAAFDNKVPVSESVGHLQELMRYLDWTVWKKCGECPLDKVCFIPIWPFGSVEDREHPQCRNATEATEFRGRGGYWGHPGPGGPRHRGL